MIFFISSKVRCLPKPTVLFSVYRWDHTEIRYIPAVGFPRLALTAAAAGPLIDRLGVGSVSIVFACLIIIAFAFAMFLPRQPIASDTPVVTFRRFGRVMFNPYFMTFIGLGVLVSVPNAMNSTFMSLYITEMGGNKQMVGWAIFTSSILEVGVFLLLDRFLKRKMSMLLASLVLVSLLFAVRWQLMAEAVNPLEIVFIQLMHSITFGGYFYVGTQLTMLFIPRPYRSSGQAVYTMAWGGISGVIAGLFGAGYSRASVPRSCITLAFSSLSLVRQALASCG